MLPGEYKHTEVCNREINFNTDTQGDRIRVAEISMKSGLSQLLSTGGSKLEIS